MNRVPAPPSYRVPVRVVVRRGEPLSAVLERVAADLGLSLPALLGWAGVGGLAVHPHHLDDPAWLTAPRRAAIARLLDVDEGTVAGASLTQLEVALAPAKGRWATLGAARETRSQVAAALRLGWSTRVCPLCVAEGRPTRLAWRTGWLFACARHGALLADTCPRCGLPLGARRRVSRVPALGRCNNHPPNSPPCGQRLAELTSIRLEAFPRLVRAQGRLEAALAGRTPRFVGQRTTPLEYLRGLGELVELLQGIAPSGALGSLPASVLDAFEAHVQNRATRRQDAQGGVLRLAAVAPLALEIADLDSLQAAENRLMNIVESGCAAHPGHALPTLNLITRLLERQRRPRLFVALRELYDRVRTRYDLYG